MTWRKTAALTAAALTAVPSAAAKHGSVATAATAPGGGHENPLMQVVDKYRLSYARREEILRVVCREQIDRWWQKYLRFKQARVKFKEAWFNWRIEAMALGPHNRSSWPILPQIPQFPIGLCIIDPQRLRNRVHSELKKSTAGKLL